MAAKQYEAKGGTSLSNKEKDESDIKNDTDPDQAEDKYPYNYNKKAVGSYRCLKWVIHLFIKLNVKYVLNGWLAGLTARLARPNSMFGRRLNRPGRFNRILDEGIRQRPVSLSFLPANHLFCQQIGRPIYVPASQYNGRTNSQTGLYPIYHVAR